jgi:hypothetical protein
MKKKVVYANSSRNSNSLGAAALLFMLCASFLIFHLPCEVKAQNQYQTNGAILSNSTNFHIIYNVKANDILFISISPVENKGYLSAIYAPNMTRIGYGSSSSYDYPKTGSHSYQYIAEDPGNYLIKLWTGPNSEFNYTITSSHPISSGTPLESTPYSTAGKIEATSTNWFTVSNVKASDLVLIGIDRREDADSHSEVFSPTLESAAVYQGEYFDGLSHSYQFIASENGNYLLKLWTQQGQAYNYTAKSSHTITSGTSGQTVSPNPQGQTPTPTVTPTPNNSIAASPSPTPLKLAVVASGSVTFEVPSNLPIGSDNFTYDFGDGTTLTTTEKKVTHVYENPGNYTFTLRLEGASENRVVETYTVTVTNPSENPLIRYTWPIVTSIIAGLSVAAITAFMRRRRKKAE